MQSRRGGEMIEVAWWLKYYQQIPVECMILFDPVDRSASLGWGNFANTKIADSVKYVIQPTRNVWSTHSRITFGKCGTTMQDAENGSLDIGISRRTAESAELPGERRLIPNYERTARHYLGVRRTPTDTAHAGR
ncbi:MAG: hypothetical protein IPJ30_23260 [Acidobacteria bacterium]|nr:hypothetical protein [Acidobacteriota bacterium]